MSRRVLLRDYCALDEAFFVQLNTDRVVRRFMDGALLPAQARALFQDVVTSQTAWLIVADGLAVGHAFVQPNGYENKPEVGVMLTPSAWGRGLGRLALQQLTQRLHHDGYPQLVATVDVDHVASQRMLTACGWCHQGTATDDQGDFGVYVHNAGAGDTGESAERAKNSSSRPS